MKKKIITLAASVLVASVMSFSALAGVLPAGTLTQGRVAEKTTAQGKIAEKTTALVKAAEKMTAWVEDFGEIKSGDPVWVVGCKESISLRTKPLSTADTITQIPLYSQMKFTSATDNGFYKVEYGDKTGYVLASYTTPYEPELWSPHRYKVVKCKKSVTLRTNPSTKAEEICQIPLGEDGLMHIEDKENGFVLVSYSTDDRLYMGYVLKDYLEDYWVQY